MLFWDHQTTFVAPLLTVLLRGPRSVIVPGEVFQMSIVLLVIGREELNRHETTFHNRLLM